MIDPGVEAYTAESFSDRRYGIWCIRRSGHNTPVINGQKQQFGRRHAARDVRAWAEGGQECFSAELAGCYAETAALTSALRMVRGDARILTIVNAVSAAGELTVTTTWYTTVDPRTAPFRLDFAGAEVAISEHPLTDPGLQASWQTQTLWRVTATARGRDRVEARLIIT